ncbi:alpha/beta fold hydrolase [Agromyces sp. SYSU T0242]|uniref:alpha/beta fold hydrolase n=1 Tax=Agromyces litoreus TaxID=3158561 RepID=UPI00339AC232
MIPPTRFASRDGVDLAYKTFGSGTRDILLAFAFVSNVDVFCELAEHLEFIERLEALDARVILFDKRGTGLSGRVGGETSVDVRADDLVAVLDAVGSRRAVLIGWFDGGATCLVAAARHPGRAEAVIAFEALAVGRPVEGFPWGVDAAWITGLLEGIGPERWGSGDVGRRLWPAAADDRLVAWWRRYESMSATPTAARGVVEEMARLDIRDALERVEAPVLVLHDPSLGGIDEAAMRWLVDRLPDGRLRLVRRAGGMPALLPSEDLVDEMEEFLVGTRSGGRREVLTTVFTDIVDSTAGLARMGDEQWRNVLAGHDRALRASIARYGGREANTTGDGVVATFALPSSALQYAAEATTAAAGLGLTIRVGMHAGEVITRDGALIGMAVHAAARICALAAPGRVLVSEAVRLLVMGSPLEFAFEDAGERTLKGVPGTWHLWWLGPGRAGAERSDTSARV